MSQDTNGHLKAALEALHRDILKQMEFDSSGQTNRPTDDAEALEILVNCRTGINEIIKVMASHDQMPSAFILVTLNEHLGIVRDYLQENADS
jgi:hypothetical protein